MRFLGFKEIPTNKSQSRRITQPLIHPCLWDFHSHRLKQMRNRNTAAYSLVLGIHSHQVKANAKQKRHIINAIFMQQFTFSDENKIWKFSIGDAHRRGLRVHSYSTQKRIWKSAHKPMRNIELNYDPLYSSKVTKYHTKLWIRFLRCFRFIGLVWINLNKTHYQNDRVRIKGIAGNTVNYSPGI